jgi:hypothetical protein
VAQNEAHDAVEWKPRMAEKWSPGKIAIDAALPDPNWAFYAP